ncbi:MAG: DUF1015 domain-containing protein [Actinomycetota bacterium]|nr:DUF1015 domain-containing protein [Actinomycetota bacterium]
MAPDSRDHGSGLVLRPFPATRYGPAVGDDIGTVTSPPYDVIDEETVGRLLESHPYNVVRLTLPRRFAQAPSYDGVHDLLQRWRDTDVLVDDPEPALYVYEYTVGRQTVRGLLGALALRDRASGVVLPHEDVMPGPVGDRAELVARTRSNLEPILLVYEGDGATSDVVEQVAEADALLDTVAPDGSRHTVWRVTDPATLSRVEQHLRPRRALIADGHHRYAAYQRVQESATDPGFGYGLAMLVDQRRYPLHLGPVHRTVSGVSLDDLVRRAPDGTTVKDFGADAVSAHRAVAQAPSGTAALVGTDGGRWTMVLAPRDGAEIDTHVLHERLLPAWGVDDSRVRYLHDAEHAVAEAREHGGVALLLRPPSVDAVVAAAEQGRSLPRKSTSFGPKPRMGLLMRLLPD